MTDDAAMGEREPELIELTLSAVAEAVEATLSELRKHRVRGCSAGYVLHLGGALRALSAYFEETGRAFDGGPDEDEAAAAKHVARVLLVCHEAVEAMNDGKRARTPKLSSAAVAAIREMDRRAREQLPRLRRFRRSDPLPVLEGVVPVEAFGDGIDGLLLTSKYQEACALCDVVKVVLQQHGAEHDEALARILAFNICFRVLFGCPRLRALTEWLAFKLDFREMHGGEVDAVAAEILDLMTQDPRDEQADPDEYAKRVVRAAMRALGVDRSKVKHLFKQPSKSED